MPMVIIVFVKSELFIYSLLNADTFFIALSLGFLKNPSILFIRKGRDNFALIIELGKIIIGICGKRLIR